MTAAAGLMALGAGADQPATSEPDADRVTRVDPALGWATLGLTAEHVTLAALDSEVVQRSRVEISAHGLSIRLLGPGATSQALYDFDNDRFWLIDRRRRVAHEVPIAKVGSERVDDADASVKAQADPARESRRIRSGPGGGLFATRPCEGLRIGELVEQRWRGRQVLSATCVDEASRVVAQQSYSPLVGLIVRSIDSSGRVEELRDIERLDFPAAHFVPKASWRSIGLRELAQGPDEVEPYDNLQ